MKEEYLGLNCSHSKEVKVCEFCGFPLIKKYHRPHFDNKTGEAIIYFDLICSNPKNNSFFGRFNTCESKFQY